MHLHWTRLDPDNLERYRTLWADRAAHTDQELRDALAVAASLLRDRRAIGALVLRGSQPLALGLSTFVDTSVVEAHLAAPHPQFGKRLLLGPRTPDGGAILDARGIAAGNAGGGLDLVILNVDFDNTDEDVDSVVGLTFQAFMETHRGYRIARIVCEAFGTHVIDVMRTSHSFEARHLFHDVGGVLGLDALLTSVTREQAARWRTPLLPTFVYAPPRIFFTAAEQELLRAALQGGTDESLSVSLGLPLTAVKARWSRINQKMLTRVPSLFDEVPESLYPNRRGARVRHIVLEFVRANPSELTPYTKSDRTRQRRGR
jgi:hypothetical protein